MPTVDNRNVQNFEFNKSPEYSDREQKKNITKLCSQRLVPTRHQTKNAILSILNDGEVN